MELTVGAIIEGKVTGITKFGAFVSLGEGKSGLVHISEISDSFVTDISQFVAVGDTVRVRILAIDADGKIRLSIKKAVERPAAETRAASPRPVAPRPAAPSPASSAPSAGSSLDDMLKRFMSESSANQPSSSSRRSGYEKRSAKKPNRRNYDD